MIKNYLGLDLGVNSISYTVTEINSDKNNATILDQGVVIINGIESENFKSGKMVSPAKIRNQFKRARITRKRKNKNKNEVSKLLKNYFGYNPLEHKYCNLNELKIEALNNKIDIHVLCAILYNYSKYRGYNELDELCLDSKDLGLYKKRIADVKSECENKGIFISEYYKQHPEINIHRNNLNNPAVILQEIYKKELEHIWNIQSKFYPIELTQDRYDELINQIYHRNKLKSIKDFKNDCIYFPKNKVTPLANPLFQRYRVWSVINYLKCKSHNLPITDNIKRNIYLLCQQKEKVSKEEIIKIIYNDWNLGDDIKNYLINYNSIKGLTTEIRIKKELNGLVLNEDQLKFCWNDVYSSSNLSKWNFKNTPILEKGNCSYSNKAIKELLSYMDGSKGVYLNEEGAFKETGFRNILNSLNNQKIKELKKFKQEDLRNPVVTKILNNSISIINNLSKEYNIDGYRIELVRELKNNNIQKESISKNNETNNKINEKLKSLVKELKGKYESRKALLKVKLWLEQAGINITNLKEVADAVKNINTLKSYCPYSNKEILINDSLNGNILDIDHIIPQSRRIDDSFNNYVLSYKEYNSKKGNRTAFEYFYDENINFPYFKNYSEYKKTQFKYADKLYSNFIGSVKPIDIDNLDFSKSNLNDTSYISKKLSEELRKISNDVIITNGSMTSIIKNLSLDDNNINFGYALSEAYFPLWHNPLNRQMIGHIRSKKTKRDDNRHHALDSFIVSLIDKNIINLFSSINNNNRNTKKLLKEYIITNFLSGESPKNWIEDNLVKSLKTIIVNQKKKSKSIYKRNDQVLVRGNLFNQTIYGTSIINGEKINTIRMKITDFTNFKQLVDIIDLPLKKNIINSIKNTFPDITNEVFKITYKDNEFKISYNKDKDNKIAKVINFNFHNFFKRIKVKVIINKPILRKGDRGVENTSVFTGNTNIWNEYTKNNKNVYVSFTMTLLEKAEQTIMNIQNNNCLKIEPYDYIVLGYNKSEVDNMIVNNNLKFIEEDKLFYVTEVGNEIKLRPHYIPTGGKVKYILNSKELEKTGQSYYIKRSLEALIKEYDKLCLIKLNNKSKISDVIEI